jgi:hypothetical protein
VPFREFWKAVGKMRVGVVFILLVSAVLLLPSPSECKKKTKATAQTENAAGGPPNENDPKQAFLSYGNNPLHDAARDGNVELVRKIVDRVPGVFTDARFSKWEYDDPEDYPDFRDKNDVRILFQYSEILCCSV